MNEYKQIVNRNIINLNVIFFLVKFKSSELLGCLVVLTLHFQT